MFEESARVEREQLGWGWMLWKAGFVVVIACIRLSDTSLLDLGMKPLDRSGPFS